jgi:hypothetical protein
MKAKARVIKIDTGRAWLAKVRRAWRRVAFQHKPSLPVTDDQISKIAAYLEVDEDSEHVAAVIKTIRRFNGRKIAMAALPGGDHRERDIETLSALARAMDGFNSNVLARLARYGIDLSTCAPAEIAAAARLAAEELERARPISKRGRKPNVSRKMLFRELAEIYTKATGKRATISKTSGSGKTKAGLPCGPFFRFMRAAVAPIPELAALGDTGLASALESRIRNKGII